MMERMKVWKVGTDLQPPGQLLRPPEPQVVNLLRDATRDKRKVSTLADIAEEDAKMPLSYRHKPSVGTWLMLKPLPLGVVAAINEGGASGCVAQESVQGEGSSKPWVERARHLSSLDIAAAVPVPESPRNDLEFNCPQTPPKRLTTPPMQHQSSLSSGDPTRKTSEDFLSMITSPRSKIQNVEERIAQHTDSEDHAMPSKRSAQTKANFPESRAPVYQQKWNADGVSKSWYVRHDPVSLPGNPQSGSHALNFAKAVYAEDTDQPCSSVEEDLPVAVVDDNEITEEIPFSMSFCQGHEVRGAAGTSFCWFPQSFIGWFPHTFSHAPTTSGTCGRSGTNRWWW
jgi:hypothetical protein